MSGKSSARRWAASLDMYRKVPMDLLEGTRSGSVLSYGAVLAMLTLFLLETRAYFSSSWVTNLALDSNKDLRVRVNFNITMMDLRCDWAVVDTVSVLGTDQNVTAHVTKWQVDADGIRQRFNGRNRDQHDIELFDGGVKDSIEDLLQNGEQAISMDQTTFDYGKNENEFMFIDFYASWCSHCRALSPTWETLAEVMDAAHDDHVKEMLDTKGHDWTDEDFAHMKKVEKSVLIGKVDCVIHGSFCHSQNIRAYPTLRLFIDGVLLDEYRGHRTVVEMADYLAEKEAKHKTDLEQESSLAVQRAKDAARRRMDAGTDEKQWADKVQKKARGYNGGKNSWIDGDHPGCQISGHVMLDRVPGNFHIQARSSAHDLVPHMTNVSHIVHHLSVGEPLAQRQVSLGVLPVPPEAKNKFSPMNGNLYVTTGLHEAYHHYLKIITTDVDEWSTIHRTKRKLKAYQIIQNSQLSMYRNDVVPEAKFIYDLSPIAVSYNKSGRHWYDYLTSLMAIVGGTFTVVGMLEGGINAATKRRRR